MNHLPNKIVYVRHPQCLHNIDNDAALQRGIENRYSPLTPLGEQQCAITAQYLMETYGIFDAVFASALTRTHAIPIAMGLESSVIIDPLLDERSMGIWHKFPRSYIEENHAEQIGKLKIAGYYHFKALDGESCPEVEIRQSEFLSDPSKFSNKKSIMISGHGISGLCFRKVLFGSDEETWHSWKRFKNASITVYERIGDTFVCTVENFAPWEEILHVQDAGTEA